MEFLNPLFWIGAAAIAAPLLLHLVHKEKTQRVPFASLMLIPKRRIKEMRRRRLTHLFLLFLRCLALLLLVAAFSRPVVTGAWLDRVNPLAARSVVILIDHSLSMSRPDVWQRAIDAAEDKIDSLGDSDEALIAAFGDGAEVVVPWENSREKLIEILRTRVQQSFEATSYLEGLRLAVEQFDEKRNNAREIYLITDFQRTGLTGSDGWKVPPDILVELEDVGVEASNLFIDEARIERDVFGKGYPHPVPVRLAGNPPEAWEGTAQLFLNGEIVDQQAFELSREGAGQITFKAFDLDEGISRGKIVVDIEDAIEDDNVFHFVLERLEPKRILIAGDPGQDSTFYLEKALSAGSNLPFRVDVSPHLSDLGPEETPLVILSDPPRLPDRSLLENYVRAGGGLILALAGATRPQVYSEAWTELLPAKPVERHFARSKRKPFTSITQVSWDHPVFGVFQDIHKASIASTQFYSYWRLQPSPEAEVVARFDEGDPALVEKTYGRGRVFVFPSSLDSAWTDFPVRSAYLPFWYQLVQYAAGWQTRGAAFRINQILPGRSQTDSGSSGSWTVIDPSGRRVVGLEERGVDSLQLKMPGHYEIRENKGTDWVAVNTLPLESDLARIPTEDIQAVFIPGESRLESPSGGQVSAGARERQQSLWWLFLVVAAVLLLFESIVANSRRTQASI